MKLTKGKDLTSDQRREVKRKYVHRHTGEHYCGISSPAPTHDTDDQWIDDHAFYVTNSGRLSRRHGHCEPAFLADD